MRDLSQIYVRIIKAKNATYFFFNFFSPYKFEDPFLFCDLYHFCIYEISNGKIMFLLERNYFHVSCKIVSAR